MNNPSGGALVGARSDAPHYGQLVVYRFPLGRQTLGPQQLQANIQQKPEFSQDITLWNQQGSHVHYGNIIVVPVGTGLLYLEPLYLQAENSRIPQLRRVIAYANGKLVWGQNLNHALGQIFGQSAAPTTPPPVPGTADVTPPLTSVARTVLLQVQAHLKAAQVAYG